MPLKIGAGVVTAPLAAVDVCSHTWVVVLEPGTAVITVGGKSVILPGKVMTVEGGFTLCTGL